MSTAITINQVTKQFGIVSAVKDLSLTIPEGTVFGFLGPNGAGKTTTVRLINNLLKPTKGSIQVLGKDVAKEAEQVRLACGVQTDTNVYESLSAYDNLALWGKLYNVPSSILNERIETLLKQFHLLSRSSDKVSTFSKGMRQKVLVARALIHNPQILFLDEPTSGLDPEATEELVQFIETYAAKQNRTVFLCSHRLEEVERLADEIGIIHKGELITSGTVDALAKALWPDLTYSVRLADMIDNPTKLRSIDSRIKTVTANGKSVVVTVAADEVIPKLIEILVHNHAQIMEVKKVVHSLQDIYLEHVPKEEQ